jgi:hypothetical protein
MFPGCSETGFRKDWRASIKMFIQRIGYHECLDAADVADAKGKRSEQATFMYFCGVCWNKIRESVDAQD